MKDEDDTGYSYHVTDQWDEALWRQAEPVYEAGFAEHGRKPEGIIRRMFKRQMCGLHTLSADGGAVVAMALAGKDDKLGVLVVDYLAVAPGRRGEGIGQRFLADIRGHAAQLEGCRGIIVEAEAEATPENQRRIRFWQACGFRLTDYVHTYIWVPEPYRAMALSFDAADPLPEDGKELFAAIIRFHERAYRR